MRKKFFDLPLPTKLLTILACVSVILGIWARFYHLSLPASVIFDEVYFPAFAWNFLHGIQTFDVHPPLGKFIIALGELLFGNNPLGWRIMPALFGVGFIFLMAAVWWRSQKEAIGTMIIAILVSIEGMWLAYSRVGLMDGVLVFFTMLTYFSALGAQDSLGFLWTATFLGLAVAIKWPALGIVVPAMYVLGQRGHLKKFFPWLLWTAFVYLLIVYSGEIISHTPSPLSAMWEWHKQAYLYHLNLTATHPWGSPWWSWPFMLKPVLMYIGNEPDGRQSIINALGNPVIWWTSSVAVFGSLFYLIAKVIRKQDVRQHPLTPLLVGYFSMWLPWMKIGRVIFLYHYLLAYAFALLILTYWLTVLWKFDRWMALCILTLCTVVGVFFLPIAVGLPLTHEQYAERMWLSPWVDANIANFLKVHHISINTVN